MKRVLLDENLPRQLKSYFSSEFEVISVPDLGWQSKKNGELLLAMEESGIAYLLTADRNLRFQQNLEKFKVTLIVLVAYEIRLKSLVSRVAEIERAIVEAGELTDVIEIDLRLK